MKTMSKILAGGAAIAALAAAAPAQAQYPYGYNNYGYASPYGYGQQYAYNPYAAQATALATQQCNAAVQARLNSRVSLGSILGAVLGTNVASGRVVSVTQVTPRQSTIRVRGLATSGQMAYSPYGVGAYGALGYGYQPDLSFKCDVDYRGIVRDVDIVRRR